MDQLEKLIRFIEKRKPILWVGAGLSIPAGYPTVGQLADRLWEEHAFDPKPTETESYKLIEVFYKTYGKDDLNQGLSKIIPAGGRATSAHLALARLAKAGCFSSVITTNYDNLLENAFVRKEVDHLPQVLDGNQEIRAGEKLNFYKIHGSVENFKSLVLTEDSYEEFNKRYGFLNKQLDVLLKQNSVLFLGCSMLDDRLLDWIKGLKSEEKEQVQTWMAVLTPGQQNVIKQSSAPSGTREALNEISFHVIDLPDFQTLPKWLEEAAAKLAGHGETKQDSELILHIHADGKSPSENWPISLNGRQMPQAALPIGNREFIKNLEALEDKIHRPLLCGDKERILSSEKQKAAVIDELAELVGTSLAAVLDKQGWQTMEKAIRGGVRVPLLRVVVEGDKKVADPVLALPWELLRLDDCFPVKEAKLDIVREVKVDDMPGIETRTGFKALVHIAAPEDDELGALAHEEEASRLTLSMSKAADDAVVFSDLGTVEDLLRTLRIVDPSIVHFTGHGNPSNLLFEDENGDSKEVPVKELLRQIRTAETDKQSLMPRIFYLASCYGSYSSSASTAAALQREGCPAVIAYFGPIEDKLSTNAGAKFYSELVSGKRLTQAVRSARLAMSEVIKDKDLSCIYPLGWAQLALYLRGGDIPVSDGKGVTEDLSALEMKLHRDASPVQALDSLHSEAAGFIGRRRDMARLRRRYRSGERLFVLHGLGGVGKTTLAINLIPKLRINPDKIILLDAVRADEAADPVRDLWEQMTGRLLQAFPELMASLLEKHKENQDPPLLFRDAAAEINEPWLVYLDNAESLQTEVESEDKELGAWSSSAVKEWWEIVSSAARHGGYFTLMATTRYSWAGLDSIASWPVGVMRKADMARMTRWFPFLSQVPHQETQEIVVWLDGHARALVYLEGLLKEILHPSSPDDNITPAEWKKAIDEALPKTETKLIDENLMLEHIWKRLDAPAREHLRTLTALRHPAPSQAIKALGSQSERLENLGLLTKFPGDLLGLHSVVRNFVERQDGPAEKKDHSRIGRWYKEYYEESMNMKGFSYEDEKNHYYAFRWLFSLEETVYHLTTAGEADLVALPAVHLGNYYRETFRFPISESVLNSVIDLSPATGKLEKLLQARGNLYWYIGRYELSAADFQTMIDSARQRASDVNESKGLHGLASALSSLGRYEDAVEKYEKSLEIKKTVYGEEHPDSLPTRMGLGNTLAAMGKIDQACVAMDKALSIARTMELPFYTGNILKVYAQVKAARDPRKALEMAEEAEKELARVFKPEHPTMRQVRALIVRIKDGPGTDKQENAPLELTADNLRDWTLGLLEGVPSVSRTVFVHLAQRIFLLISMQGNLLTYLAFRMNRPGLELEDPEALETPEDMPPEQAEKLKSSFPDIKSKLKQVAEAVGEKLKDLPQKEGRIVLERRAPKPIPEQASSVLLDEVGALTLSASEESLRAELDLVLKGLSIILQSTDDPGAMRLASRLLDRLPDQRERIAEALRPLCSEEQRHELESSSNQT